MPIEDEPPIADDQLPNVSGSGLRVVATPGFEPRTANFNALPTSGYSDMTLAHISTRSLILILRDLGNKSIKMSPYLECLLVNEQLLWRVTKLLPVWPACNCLYAPSTADSASLLHPYTYKHT